MNYKSLFYFDIETVSKYKDINDFKENDNRGYDIFLRKIERKSERFIEWKSDLDIVYANKAPLMPEFGKIVCISMAYFKNEELKLKSIYDHNEENIIIEAQKIFKNIGENTIFNLCGYYIKGFDIPWLNKKFLKYGLEIPKLLKTYNIKPWELNVYDLADIWRTTGTLENSSFDEMLYELNIESPKDDISGNDVNTTYWIDDDLERIKNYCEKDVLAVINATKKIYQLI